VRTSHGELAFQDYFVRLRCRPRVEGFRYAGSRRARVPEPLLRLIGSGAVRAVIICPSNPYVSIAPILSIPALGAWLQRRSFPVVAVSPIVGGKALKGPAAKIMRELGAKPGAAGLARHYRDLVDAWVIDDADAREASRIEREGSAVTVTDTIMRDRARSAALAGHVLALARTLSRRKGRR
jgi:LPPG:FO 2-phospho-L-lactate transferase